MDLFKNVLFGNHADYGNDIDIETALNHSWCVQITNCTLYTHVDLCVI